MAEFAEELRGSTDGTFQPRINEMAQNFIADLEKERERLAEGFPLINILVDEAIERIYSTGRVPGKEFYADVYKQKPIKISQKVFVPVKQYPKFNFTGKILGPKGNSLRRLQDETQCRITIKGRSSIRDRNKEEELRNSGDARYAHLNKDLFLEIATVASPAEAYARVAYALAEIRKYLVPDKNDDVSYEQLRELMEIDPAAVKIVNNGGATGGSKSVFEKKISGKFMGFMKNDEEEMEPESEHDGYRFFKNNRTSLEKESYDHGHHYINKRESVGGEYGKPRLLAAGSTFAKRGASNGAYASEVKRLRESGVGPTGAKVAPYKQNPYGIMKKYK